MTTEHAPFFTLDVMCTCAYCNQKIKGKAMISKSLKVVDSPGFMLFEDGIMCEKCLSQRGMGDPNEEVDVNNLNRFTDTLEGWGYEPKDP